ncbi:MAG: head GIN domain-containing protein [Sediminibacterium sp.]
MLGYQRVRGNGHLSVEQRNVTSAERIKLAGSYDVELTQGPVTSVKVEADENLQPYIITNEREGVLEIRTRDHYSLSSNHTARIFVTTNKLEQVQLAGSGNITGRGKFTGAEKLTIKIAGSGDVRIEVNTPEIGADIAGSGTITLTGETRDESIHISGVGKYDADGLKAESAKVKIAGSGDVKVFADRNLDINIAGVGSVYYKGAAAVKQKIAGSGEVKRIE